MNLRYVKQFVLLVGIVPMILWANPADDLKSAAEAGDVAFVLVTDPNAIDVDQARGIIGAAMGQVRKSVMVELDRSDPNNSDLVMKYRLAAAPVPLVLVFASNGVLAGGKVAAQITPDQLVSMVPTPKKTQVIQAIQSGKSVFLTATRKSMVSGSKVMGACAAACQQMKGGSVSIQVDMDDNNEVRFMNELKINRQSTKPVTVVINAKGQVTGTLEEALNAGNLVQAATQVASSGCCPAGSGKTCGPVRK
jgi:hypothetical protein